MLLHAGNAAAIIAAGAPATVRPRAKTVCPLHFKARLPPEGVPGFFLDRDQGPGA
jgi:hypothetical protein